MTTTTARILLLFLPIFGMTSCSKDDDGGTPVNPAPNETARNYMPGEAGSYWVYETYVVDSNGNGDRGQFGSTTPLVDSFFAMTDTSIGTTRFHRMRGPVEPGSSSYETSYFRDSASYLLGLRGDTLLAANDTNRVFYSRSIPGMPVSRDSAVVLSMFSGAGRLKTVPLGVYQTLATVSDWAFLPYAADNKAVTHRRQYRRFAKGVGLVSETLPFFANDPRYLERRLVRSRVLITMQ